MNRWLLAKSRRWNKYFSQNSSVNAFTGDSLSGVVVVIMPLRNCRLKLWSR
jgi:hypothetical protein